MSTNHNEARPADGIASVSANLYEVAPPSNGPTTDPGVEEVAGRIRALREDLGISQEEMARCTGRTLAEYAAQESGAADPSFTFLSKCAERLGVDMVELLTGESPRLARFAVTRAGAGVEVHRRATMEYLHMAPFFKNRQCEPLFVTAPYLPEEQDKPVHLTRHPGQEFDYVLDGTLRFSYEGHEEILHPGDSVIFDPRGGHGMIATGGQDCHFLAIVMRDPAELLQQQVG